MTSIRRFIEVCLVITSLQCLCRSSEALWALSLSQPTMAITDCDLKFEISPATEGLPSQISSLLSNQGQLGDVLTCNDWCRKKCEEEFGSVHRQFDQCIDTGDEDTDSEEDTEKVKSKNSQYLDLREYSSSDEELVNSPTIGTPETSPDEGVPGNGFVVITDKLFCCCNPTMTLA